MKTGLNLNEGGRVKKFIFGIVANIVFLVLIAPDCHAAEVAGTVISVDIPKGTLVFVPKNSKEQITLKVRKDVLINVKPKEKVKITHDKGVLYTIKKDRGPVKIPVGCGAD